MILATIKNSSICLFINTHCEVCTGTISEDLKQCLGILMELETKEEAEYLKMFIAKKHLERDVLITYEKVEAIKRATYEFCKEKNLNLLK